MSKTRLVLLSLVAVLSVGAMVASSASAAITFQWKVGGSLLKLGENKTFTSSADGKISVLKGTVSGTTTELLSSKLKVKPGALIIGGQPGKDEETVEFESVVVDRPANCEVDGTSGVTGVIPTAELTSEIVEGAVSKFGNGEPLILFKPKSTTNEIFTEFTFLGSSCGIKGVKAAVTSLLLALPLPQQQAVTPGVLDYEANTHEYLAFGNGTAKKAGLTFAGSAATFTGLALVVLTSGETFGAF